MRPAREDGVLERTPARRTDAERPRGGPDIGADVLPKPMGFSKVQGGWCQQSHAPQIRSAARQPSPAVWSGIILVKPGFPQLVAYKVICRRYAVGCPPIYPSRQIPQLIFTIV